MTETVELFSGMKSFSNYAEKCGFKTFTVDIEKKFNPSLCVDLLKPFPKILEEKLKTADIIWMSPPCQTFSMAAGYKHWTSDRRPKTTDAVAGYMCLMICKEMADFCEEHNKIFFIENPVARARWFLPKEWRRTVWYCQYGDERAKPTDIWTNLKGWGGRMCKNNNPECNHIRSPRGTQSGTQGQKNAIVRSIIPEKLFEELFSMVEKNG